MSMFSQSLAMGDDTFSELENPKRSDPQRPPESLEIIEESPTSILASRTNRSRLTSMHRTQSHSSRTQRGIKRNKSDSILLKPDQNVMVTNESYSDLFRSNLEYDFDTKENVNNLGSKPNTSLENYFKESMEFSCASQLNNILKQDMFASSNFYSQPLDTNTDDIQLDEAIVTMANTDMEWFDELNRSVQEVKDSPKVSAIREILRENCSFEQDKSKKNEIPLSQNICWEDSGDFNQAIFNDPPTDSQDEAAVCIDNVTFTQDFLNSSIKSKPKVCDSKNSHLPNQSMSAEFIHSEMVKCQREVSQGLAETTLAPNNSLLNADISSSSNMILNYSAESLPNTRPTLQYDPKQNDSPKTSIVPKQLASGKNLNQIDQWGLLPPIVREYHRKGVRTMFDWQVECLSNPKVLFEGANLVYSAPTSAGKTLVSEILMIKNILERHKKSLFILPFISVVREKMFYLQELLSSAELTVEGYFGGYTPPCGFEATHLSVCTIEKANSIINKLLESGKIDTLGCIVVDEIHLIADPGRGYILELLLAKILYVTRRYGHRIQIVTMSATLPNLDLLTKWLDAQFYKTDFRPVALMEMMKLDSTIYDSALKMVRQMDLELFAPFGKDPDGVGQLCVETMLEGCSVIVFCPSKDWCESLSTHVAGYVYAIGKSKTELGELLRSKLDMNAIEEVKSQLRNSATGLDAVLEKCLSYACSFHHAGLTTDERDIVECAFKAGTLKVIIATSTLSSGVNLPARRVIIRTPMFGGKTMNSLTYRQMIGRAGRTGKDTLGESILICTSTTSKSGKDLVCAKLSPLASCLDSDGHVHLKRAILEIIASGMASTKTDLEGFTNSTLLASEQEICFSYAEPPKRNEVSKRKNSHNESVPEQNNNNPIVGCINFLLKFEFIRKITNDDTGETNFVSTRLGNACLASSMPPEDGFLLFSELQKSRQNFVLESELHAVYLVTPFSVCYQLQDIDWLAYLDMWEKLPSAMRRVGELVGVKESFLVKAMRSRTLDFKLLQVHKRFYTALALQELVNEININTVAAKYKFSRGQLQSLQQMASTFAGVVTHFCTALNWNLLALIIGQFKERLFFGVHRDLIDLMRLPHLNGVRARALFDGGCKTLADLATSNLLTVERILFDSFSFDAQQRDGETDFEAAKRNKIRFLYVTGRAGLTIREAAKLMIEDARRYLEMEMGVNVQWKRDESVGESEHIADRSDANDNGANVVVSNLMNTETTSTDISDLKIEIPLRKQILRDNSKDDIKQPVLKNAGASLPLQHMPESEDIFQSKSPTNFKRKSSDSEKGNVRFERPVDEARRPNTRKSPRIEAQKQSTSTKIEQTKLPKRSVLKPNEITPTKIDDAGRESDCEIIQTPVQSTQRNRSTRNKTNALKSTNRKNRPTPLINTPNPMRNQLIDVDDMDSIGFSRSEENSSSTSLLNASHIMSVIKQSEHSEHHQATLNKIEIINVCGNVNLFRQFTETIAASKTISMAIAVAHNMPSLNRRTQVIGGNLLAEPSSADDTIDRRQRNCVFDEDVFYVTGIGFAIDDSTSCFYVNMQRSDDLLVSFEEIIGWLTAVCRRPDLTIRMYDAKEQCKVLRKAIPSIAEVVCSLEDPRIAYWLLHAEGQAGLKEMAKQFAPECLALCDLGGDGRHNGSISLNYLSDVDPKRRAAVECSVSGMILAGQKENLQRLGNGEILKSFMEMEMPIQHSLAQMEITGLPVAPEAMERLTDQINDLMKQLERQMFRVHGRPFNIASSIDVGKVLRMHSGKNGTTKMSTAKAVLEKITDDPMSGWIMQWRKLSACISKTLRPLQRNIYQKRVHGNSYSFTSTGRISMHEPNVQNVAKEFVVDLESGSHLVSCRSVFRCPPGRMFISADFCQLELRILTHLSQDATLLRVMSTTKDVFTTISADWNGLAEKEITEQQRNVTKQICYGIIYGMGPKATADGLKCSEEEATSLIDSFHQNYPAIRTYTNQIVDFASINGYIETLAGRRRYLPAINADDSKTRSQSERQAINTTIQGSAADVAKYAVLRMERNIRKYERTLKLNVVGLAASRVDLVMHLHDELIYEVPADKVRQVAKILRSSMENCAKMNVPLMVKLRSGPSWGEMVVQEV